MTLLARHFSTLGGTDGPIGAKDLHLGLQTLTYT